MGITFADYLADKGLLPQTVALYDRVVRRAGADPIAYLTKLVRRRAAEGTVVQAHAAIAHLLAFQGKTSEEIEVLLPTARGRKAERKDALTPEALKRYQELAGDEREPIRSVLLLLPLSGLRIAEACALTCSDVRTRGERVSLSLRGKGDKPRVVPLGEAGTALVQARIAALPKDGTFLFALRAGAPVSPNTVRDAIARFRAGEDLLEGVTPHALRHTYATRAIAAGVPLPHLQSILGHANIGTTQRYLHPSDTDLAASVAGIQGL